MSKLIDCNFDHHLPDDATANYHDEVRKRCKELAEFFDSKLPECRERSLALTKLEEAMFWANAAIAREITYKTRTDLGPK